MHLVAVAGERRRRKNDNPRDCGDDCHRCFLLSFSEVELSYAALFLMAIIVNWQSHSASNTYLEYDQISGFQTWSCQAFPNPATLILSRCGALVANCDLLHHASFPRCIPAPSIDAIITATTIAVDECGDQFRSRESPGPIR